MVYDPRWEVEGGTDQVKVAVEKEESLCEERSSLESHNRVLKPSSRTEPGDSGARERLASLRRKRCRL